jgi:ribonuclease-3
MTEGTLTKLRSSLVRNKRLADLAKVLRLGEAIHLPRGELENGGRQKPRILSGCFEALVGALYLDQGYMNARKFVDNVVLKDAYRIIEEHLEEDFKSVLNEYCQRERKMSPRYETEDEFGPNHSKTFVVAVFLADRKLGHGEGKSKQEAENRAEKDDLRWFRRIMMIDFHESRVYCTSAEELIRRVSL